VGGTSLPERLRARIARKGPLRFDAFQESALYDPDGGYYERAGRVGRSGDFVTGASWHPAFARCLARIVALLADEIAPPVDVVDFGAGEGELLAFLSAARPQGLGVRLAGVEASTVRRVAAEARVPGARLVASVADLPSGSEGLFVAYELFDALPVRALRVSEDGSLVERRVGNAADGGFDWSDAPCPDGEELLTRFYGRGALLEPGQLLEVRPGAAALAREIGARLAKGILLVFDYGAPTRALYGPARVNGTLEAFVGHRVTRDVLADPGSRDITSWVDFTEIEMALSDAGLTVHGLVSQSRLLLASGIAGELLLAPGEDDSPERAAERNAVAKLVMPGGMGESIRVLVAERKTGLGKSLISNPLV
jgi:SAM-dependent MidA family methyltransferase